MADNYPIRDDERQLSREALYGTIVALRAELAQEREAHAATKAEAERLRGLINEFVAAEHMGQVAAVTLEAGDDSGPIIARRYRAWCALAAEACPPGRGMSTKPEGGSRKPESARTGTRAERQARLVEIAKQMGFPNAAPCYEDEDGEYLDPESDLTAMFGATKEPIALKIDLGVTAWAATRPKPGSAEDDGEWTILDTSAQAEAWIRAGKSGWRVGKKRSGRMLDGRTHDDLPWRLTDEPERGSGT